jgi:hypothetical protein
LRFLRDLKETKAEYKVARGDEADFIDQKEQASSLPANASSSDSKTAVSVVGVVERRKRSTRHSFAICDWRR